MFKVTARTILELGSELISSDPIAFYELVKNGIDARTQDGVKIKFDIVLARRDYQETKSLLQGVLADEDEEPTLDDIKDLLIGKLNTEANKLWEEADGLIADADDYEELLDALEDIDALNSITISDTGSGMSLEQLSDVFLVIGTGSRKKDIDSAIERGDNDTPYLGEKGIGRLSAMRLGEKLSVRTATEDESHYNRIDIDWADFDDASKMIEDIKIEPRKGKKKSKGDYSGTDIRIQKLNADWSEKRVDRLAIDDFSLLANPLAKKSKQPIAVFWNKKRVHFRRLEKSFLSHANALIRGSYRVKDGNPELELRIELVNLGFDHPKEISIETATSDVLHGALVGLKAKRRRMNKRDLDYSALKRIGPFDFELHWFNRSILRKGKSTGEYDALRNLLDQWKGVRLYRDNFRVYPYGSEDNDWLELDKTALQSKGYALNRLQLVGQVEIGRLKNPKLVDQTNREGLRQTPEEAILKETVEFAVERLRDEMNRITAEQKGAKEIFVSDETQTIALEKRMKSAIRSIGKVVPKEHRDAVEELELMREEFARYASRARDRVADMEKDADQMLAMAGIGLMVEVVAHELTRSAEDALDVLNNLKRKTVPEDVRRRLESLRASMTSISKRLRILDPLSVTGRQRSERFDLNELVTDLVDAHEAQFTRHKVAVQLHCPERPVKILAVKGMVVQVLENLISNSLYWMAIEKDRKMIFAPELTILVESDPPRIRFSDNGPGIPKQYKDRIFDLFFSLKDKNRRRGLGLFIAKEAAEHKGGSLTLDTDVTNDERRFTTFDYLVVGDDS
ncbi:sensor histidine kinase [Parasphingorhabdus sp.]|uniref:sensor histidine kinase n=1 Tax=Parasphingorhabdus sp. TaxID=2709688 RepID=UPI003264906F